jgi:tetratricopeptide (TPR) repeat protein
MVRAALGDEVTGRLMELLEREPDGERIAVLVAATVGEAEPSADDQETVWAIRRFFEALDPGRPLMLVFDDVHWAVPTLLDLIEHLAAGVRGRPLFVLCLARTELLDARPGWAGQGSSLRLEPLTDDQAERMLDERLEDRALEPDVRRRIIRSSQGVPMFVEQMLALLDERRALRADDVPPAISALLAARLDALRGDERRALERASVEGELFHCGAVAALVDEPVGQVVRLLRGLEARELVRADDARLASEQGFRFTHALIRDAAYDRVSKADRAALHEQLAGWLEVHGAGDELVGYHLERAVRLGSELAPRDDRCRALARQAAGRLAAAGRRAHDRGDYKGGANLLERACDLLPDEDQDRIGMLPELGVLLSEVDVASAVPLLTQAIEQARTTENRRVEWESTVIRSRVLMYADPAARSPGDLLAEGERATAELEALGDDWGVASALILRADAHLMLGQLSHCYGLCLRAAAHGRGPVRTRALAMAAYGLCRGDTVAHDAEARCHELLKAAGEGRRARAFISSELGWSQALQGRIKEGRLLTRSARDELDELGVVAWLGSATLACGFVEQLAGDAVAAERHFAEAQQTFLELDDDWSLSEAVVNRALALCDLSRHTEALEVSKHPQVPHEPEWVINWNRVQALAIVAQGSPEPALAHAEVAVRTAEDTEYLNYHAAALADRASIHHLLGHPAAARADLKAALDLYGRKGNAVDARRIQERLTEPARS